MPSLWDLKSTGASSENTPWRAAKILAPGRTVSRIGVNSDIAFTARITDTVRPTIPNGLKTSARSRNFLPRLATRYLDGDDIGGQTRGCFIPTRAVDASLAYKKLLIVEADRVVSVPIDSIIAKGESLGWIDSSPLEISPIFDIPWEKALGQDWNLVPADSI